MRVFITGANRGLGLELTRQYLERGDQVFAASRQPAAAADLQRLHQQYADRLVLLPLDVTSDASIAAAVAAVAAETDALDVLINNAGVYPHAGSGDAHQRLGQLTHDDAIEALQVNAIGPLLVAQALLPLLRAGVKGRILSMSSGQGSLTWKATGDPYHYSASKAALNMYMRSLAAEIGAYGLISVLVDPRLDAHRHGRRLGHPGAGRLGPRHHSPGRAAARRGKRQLRNLAGPARAVVVLMSSEQ